MKPTKEKTPVLIVCDSGSGAGKTVRDTLTRFSDVELMWSTDLFEVERQLSAYHFAFVVIDTTMEGLDYRSIGDSVRASDKGYSVPLVFILQDMEDVEHLYRVFGTAAVDCLSLPLSVNLVKNRAQLLLELYRLNRRLDRQKTDFDATVLELEVLHQELEEKRHSLELFTSLDGLTGLFNRYYFDENLHKEWRQALRENEPLSLLFLDVDYLKAYNEHYGHAEGDDCLREIAGVLYHSLLRPVDIVARYGGDQFAVILPGTDMAGAGRVARRMMENVTSLKRVNIVSPASDCVTISIGYATILPFAGDKIESFTAKAEQALAKAKAAGRNRISPRDFTVKR